MMTPDKYAELATALAEDRALGLAAAAARASIEARAHWVLVNGKWQPRQGILRG